jgi:pyruvate kinase
MLPDHKTRIVCTIGPASEDPGTLREMIRAGMNVARLNFSHGEFPQHAEVIERIRAAAAEAGVHIAIMADLPGPKLRVGPVADEPVVLLNDAPFTLTTEEIVGGAERVSVDFPRLPDVVSPGHLLSINDGLIQLEVLDVAGPEVHCRVRVGGELSSRKGLNLPGIDLGASAFTPRDRECLEFALAHGVDAVSQSFVNTAHDVEMLREAAAGMGHSPFVIAKIERAGALTHYAEILVASDGIMVARGDLGVEIPIEEIAIVQKQLTEQANAVGKPVITATHMLESMCHSRRPTRAEATDVANAILDGTDCVMLSGESAVGQYPVQAVRMLARIAAVTEPHRREYRACGLPPGLAPTGEAGPMELVAIGVREAVERSVPSAVVVPTVSGRTARNVTRSRLPVWVTAISPRVETCRHLAFSYGVCPVLLEDHPVDWTPVIRRWLESQGIAPGLVILTEGPSSANPGAHHRMEVLELA